MNRAYMLFTDGTSKMVSKGDILALSNGQVFSFIEAKRTRWVGQDQSGKQYSIPNSWKPVEIRGKDAKVTENIVKKMNFKPGQIFSIQGRDKVFMFKSTDARTGKLVAFNLADGTVTMIDRTFTFEIVDINKYKKLVNS